MADPLYRKSGRRYLPAPDAVASPWGWQALMPIAAHRYCLGRMTYIVGACADWLVEQWPALPENARQIIQRDTEEAFARDDEARAIGDQHKPLGYDCDRRDWERVRALWASAPPAAPHVPDRPEIVRRLRWLAIQMAELGQAMEYAGGFGETGDHGRELQTQALAATQWATDIEEVDR